MYGDGQPPDFPDFAHAAKSGPDNLNDVPLD